MSRNYEGQRAVMLRVESKCNQSMEQYSALTDEVEMKLDEADRQASSTTERLSHQTVFENARRAAHAK